MQRSICRFLTCLLVILAICAGRSAHADWLYEGHPIYNLGVSIGKGRPTEMVAQPFSLPHYGRIDQIGIALAGGADPNRSGFRVMLATDPRELSKTTVAAWQVFPANDTALAFTYLAIKPVSLDALRTYYMVVAPGDSEVMGAVAYASCGNTALATNDHGSNWFDIAQLGVRIGGTVVPEPSAFMVLGAGCPVLGLRRRRRVIADR